MHSDQNPSFLGCQRSNCEWAVLAMALSGGLGAEEVPTSMMRQRWERLWLLHGQLGAWTEVAGLSFAQRPLSHGFSPIGLPRRCHRAGPESCSSSSQDLTREGRLGVVGGRCGLSSLVGLP